MSDENQLSLRGTAKEEWLEKRVVALEKKLAQLHQRNTQLLRDVADATSRSPHTVAFRKI